MKYTASETELLVTANSYSLNFSLTKPYVILTDSLGNEWMKLFIASNVHTARAQDALCGYPKPDIEEADGKIQIKFSLESILWEKEELVFVCDENNFKSYVTISGKGDITDLHMFGGFLSDSPIGTCYFSSEALFKSVFTPAPSMSERWVTPVFQSARISVTGSSYPGQGGWFFTPPPLCYGFSHEPAPLEYETVPEGNWIMSGVIAKPGEHNFTSFKYAGEERSFNLELSYEGHTSVDGEWTSPEFMFIFNAETPYQGLSVFSQFYKYVTNHAQKFDWWKKPIFCGWGAQCCIADSRNIKAPTLATQDNYDQFLKELSEKRLIPTIVTIDDKWQKEYGLNSIDEEKWPDLKGWIKERHKAGQKVLLWLKAWDCEGLPDEVCVRNAKGRKICVDPTNPEYRKLLQYQVRYMLSKKGLNADGFKIDFTARTPSGPSLKAYGGQWGMEMLHTLLDIIYNEAKSIKEDALIVTHTPNPYFQDVTDMIRLNDINTGAPVVPQMMHRAKIALAACPNHPIDTDNWLMPNIYEWRSYMKIQHTLGVPCLYYTTHVTTEQEITEDDYEMIRQNWANYSL